MEQNEQLREYLIIKKEAYHWLLWWGLAYLIGVAGVIILLYNDLPSYNQIEKEHPEFKAVKTTEVVVPMSMRKKR